MKKMFLRPHLGLGDHIVCNGMVRHFAETYMIKMPCKKHNMVSVSYMFSDLPNVDIIPVDDDRQANSWASFFRNKGYEIMMLGQYGNNFNISDTNRFDKVFYSQAGIDHSIKRDKFKIPRRLDVEKNFFNDFYGFQGEFTFVHEDKNRNYLIRKEMLNSNLPMVCPNKDFTGNIFNYCWILENSIQIDCLDSSFSNIADLLNLKATTKRIHMYARPDTVLPSYMPSWELIR